MKKTLIALSFIAAFFVNANAQIINGTDTLYGNEWIKYNQPYYKILVAQDGIHRLTGQALSDAGIPLSQAPGSQLQLFYNGEEVPLHATTNGTFSPSDYLEFFGKKNTSELDRHLFKDPDAEMMNPLYSLSTDTSAYFLTWSATASPLRYQTIPNNLTNLPPKEPFYMAKHVQNYFSAFSKKANSQGISSSDYGLTEGYSNAFANVQTIAVTAPNPFPGGPDGSLYLRYGSNIGSHQQLITLNDQPLLTDEFFDFQVRQHSFAIPNATLQSAMSLKFQGLASNTDRQRIANVILTYPAQWKANNQTAFSFEMPASATVRYLEIENFNAANGTPVLYDLTNRTRLTATFENNVVKIALPPAGTPVHLVLVNDATGVKTPPIPAPVQFIDYQNINAQFILLSNPRLYDDGNGNNYVQQYADYRSSAAGGGYSTVIVDVQQLYDQFGWGLHRHPLSIRNFAHYVKREWADVAYFFVVGKGREYTAVRTQAQLSNANNVSYYVPTFGLPGADNLLVSVGGTATPMVPFGRLAASTPEDISLFLKKVTDFEANVNAGQTIEERQWMKNIIHLGGGGVASEQALIRNYLTGMENIVRNNLFGANVTSFYKTSTDPIQVSKSEQIFERINKGVSIITFFGHSAVGTFDFNIDNPDNYNNFKKYPILFSLDCYSGNIHTGGLGISERFIFQKDKAAIGMVATTGQGYISALNTVMSRFYTNLGGDYYGQSIGVLLQKTIEHFDGTNSTQPELLQQFTYHGDPAVKIFASDGPDYLIDAASVNISPKNINIRQDSFTLRFSVANIGKGVKDSIAVKIEHELPDGNRFTAATLQIPAPAYQSDFEVKLSTVGKVAVGRNRLYIAADAADAVTEHPLPAAEMNNELVDASGQKGVSFFITDNGATPVYPSNFAIVGEAQVTLRASTSDALAPLAKYVFELDTTALFNSPLKISTVIQQSGGLLEWKPGFSFENEKVYYWRISPDSVSQEVGYAWETRSFTYIGGSPGGWSQRHYWQFLENRMEDMRLEEGSREFKFAENFIDFRIRNKLFNASDPPNGFMNGIRWSDFFRWELQGSLTVVVFDTLGRIQFNWNPGEYGSVNTTAARIGAYPFPVETTVQREKVIDFIENIVPENAWVIVYTAQRTLANDLKVVNWEADSIELNGKNLFNLLEGQGAEYIRNLKDQLVPYYFAFRKNKGAILEQWADSPEGEINPEISVPGVWYEGRTQSVNIGPSSKWDSFQWQFDNSGIIDKDTFFVDIFGMSKDQLSSQLLFEKVMENSLDLTTISTDSFPYLRLEFYAKDSIERSPVQLKEWSILYQGLPDAAFHAAKHFLFHRDTLAEGDKLRLESFVAATNAYTMDSLLVRYEIRDKAGNLVNAENRVGKLLPDVGIDLVFSHPTKGLAGEHQLIAQLNPDDDHPELHAFNNFLIKDFYVQRDRRNPLLDVTFDGIHIFNGDIVSPRPDITIALKDENPFLLLNDTSTYKMFLLLPDGELRNIPLNAPEISFQAATSASDNRSSLNWRPEFTQDGEYALIVQATDATGNNAGAYDYKVSFKVILESMISNVLAYPNPFSTATRFVYTLTGEPPRFFKIQIMTVSGRIVREITQDEIGALRIGTHQSDFVWDGTDEFGDRLANGIYLYRVLAKDEDKQEYKRYETGADGFFKEGFGKLAIIR